MDKKQIEEYLRNNELDVQRATASLTNADMCWSAYVRCKKVLGTDFSPAFGYIGFKPKKIFYQINLKENINRIVMKTYQEYLKNQKTLSNKINTHITLQKKIDKAWQDYKNGKITEINFFKKFETLCRSWWIVALIGEDKGDIISRVIIPKFAKAHKLSAETAVSYINLLSHPSVRSRLSGERSAFLDICLAYLENKNFDEKINCYIDNFFWFKTDFYQATEITGDLTLKEVKKELSGKNKIAIEAEINSIDKNFDEIEQQKEELKNNIKLSPEDKKDIKFSEMIIDWGDLRKVHMMTQFHYLSSLMKDVSKKTKIPFEDLVAYTFGEFSAFLADGKKVSKEELEKRNNGAFLLYEKDQDRVKFFYGKDGKELLDTAINKKHNGEIKGQVASTGSNKLVRGTVSVISDPSREQFREGDVLVTSMTRIEFVPLMRKAKAIITDEGGIACHAAIVSRELGIPCIIGTKTATKILKNGDEVEMDLDKGMVKIIK